MPAPNVRRTLLASPAESHSPAQRSPPRLNVLLITFSFPPAGGVGVLRALSLAKYLPENGIRLDVLTARNAPSVGKDLSLLEQVPASVTVHRTWTLDLPFALRKALKSLVGGSGQPSAPPATAPTRRSLQQRLRTLVANLLLPDPQIGWLPFALPAARRIVRRRSIDAVVLTVPPFSTALLVGRLRKHFPALPIVLDFRDEWLSTTLDLVSFNNNQRARTVAQQAEAEAVRAATTVVSVSEAARRELLGRYPGQDPAKFICIPNGFDTALPSPQPSAAPRGRIILTYIGSVYGSTDPTRFIDAVLTLPADLRLRLHIRYIGHIETPALRASLLRLGNTLKLQGFVPQAEALRAIDSTDYLLLITHDRINVAAKFYDYLGGGKPIVAAVHPAGDVRRLLEETGAGIWADIGSVDAIRAMLVQLLNENSPTPLPIPNLDRIASYHRRPLAARYAALLKAFYLPL